MLLWIAAAMDRATRARLRAHVNLAGAELGVKFQTARWTATIVECALIWALVFPTAPVVRIIGWDRLATTLATTDTRSPWTVVFASVMLATMETTAPCCVAIYQMPRAWLVPATAVICLDSMANFAM